MWEYGNPCTWLKHHIVSYEVCISFTFYKTGIQNLISVTSQKHSTGHTWATANFSVNLQLKNWDLCKLWLLVVFLYLNTIIKQYLFNSPRKNFLKAFMKMALLVFSVSQWLNYMTFTYALWMTTVMPAAGWRGIFQQHLNRLFIFICSLLAFTLNRCGGCHSLNSRAILSMFYVVLVSA